MKRNLGVEMVLLTNSFSFLGYAISVLTSHGYFMRLPPNLSQV